MSKLSESRRALMSANKSRNGTNIVTETVDVIADNQRIISLTVPVTSTNYDNIILTFSVIETGHYVDDSLVVDEVPTIPTSSDGIDFAGCALKLSSAQRFTGLINGAYQYQDYPNVGWESKSSGRNSNTPQTYGSSNFPNIYGNSLVIRASRAFCQSGYKMKYRFKILFWND